MHNPLKILLNPKKAEQCPIEMIFVGFFYATISITLSWWIFPEYATISMIFLTTLSCIFVVQRAIIIREEKESHTDDEANLLLGHFKTLSFLIFLFLGFVIAFTFWTIVLPHQTVETIFDLQESTIMGVSQITGAFNSEEVLISIIFNNLRVLFLAILFALFYGAGAIFILVWNASIMGFVIGELARNTLGLQHIPLITLKYFLHGIPEILAYFIGALAGGIIFITLIRGDFRKKRIRRTIIDVTILILIAILLIIFAALIEVFISCNI